jgi:phospholipid/cholesterol/gamma-HCH transport system substrate-binding protein
VKRSQEALVGAVIIAGIAIIVFGTMWLKGAKLGKEDVVVQARFKEVGLLSRGNPVKMRGVPIGRVETVELEPNSDGVRVTMSIQKGINFPRDPVVLLSPKSMFGDWQAEIFPRSSFPQYDYAEAADRKVLPGYTLPDITRLTAVADQIARNLAVLSDRFGIAFTEETALNIRNAIDNIADVSGKLTGMVGKQQKDLEAVSQSLQSTSASLGAAAEGARRAFAQLDSAIGHGEMKDIVGNVRGTTTRIDSLSRVMLVASRDLRRTTLAADSAFRAVAEVATSVRRGRGTLGKLTQDSTLYYQLVQTNMQMQELLKDLKANPKKYINVHVF